ncbi:MAG: hypothetical protein WCG14_06565 [Chlamydiia bacterium]
MTLIEDYRSRYTEEQYGNQLKFWAVKIRCAVVQESETNGVVGRCKQAVQEQFIHRRIFRTLEEARACIGTFVEQYKEFWLIEKIG